MARAGVVTNTQADLLKVLETQNQETRRKTVLGQVDVYAKTILSLLDKLEINSRDDVIKFTLVLINELIIDPQAAPFTDALLGLSSIDSALPYNPFVKHLSNNDQLIKTLAFYNTTVLLCKSARSTTAIDKEILIKLLDIVCSKTFIANKADTNVQSIGVQLLQELVIVKQFRAIFQEHNLVSNFTSIAELIELLARQPNLANLQLLYNLLMTTWVLSFHAALNKVLVHHFPNLVGNLLTISKEGIKLKVVRVAVSALRNFVSFTVSHHEHFSVVKLLLFHDGLNIVKTIQTRKFASKSSDEELANDLAYLNEELSDVVANKLTSLDEYLVELENPNLLSWASPTHKSEDFWQEHSHKFRENSFALVKRILAILESDDESLSGLPKVILLSNLQHLIKNLGVDLINFINAEKDGQYKLLIMGFLENSSGDNELKYEALRTIQYLVGHA